ncbi:MULTISPECIES: acyl-CoA carboxylase subunit epsilon [Micromonospora]|uniref:Acyl-CoA carboxylase epsilon subunit n=1 Tax=Micromonospora yangpuensis TaxID=683228 RepID=A0A1C6U6S1_9ACTN|nr:acyl-CoA carboxylase subunit epsilon [Micromonospora yangpuensis]GGL91023.1 acetyl-CoA carboxylase biotin carboxyl carrier protein subunit [Micromonospora yangpuensis]SCL49529.1 Acyl-CoA carboxylase epsilon subunit [Micromonospora yangpuensis]
MSSEEPLFRVVRGVPSDEELVALVGVLAARSRPSAPPVRPTASAWARSAHPAGATRGTGGWRASGLPR